MTGSRFSILCGVVWVAPLGPRWWNAIAGVGSIVVALWLQQRERPVAEGCLIRHHH